MPTKYRLIRQTGAWELNKEVNECLLEGWELYGSPFSSNHSYKNLADDVYYCQALIKKEVT